MGPTNTLPPNCTDFASPLSSSNGYQALRCAGLVDDAEFLLQLLPDQQGSLNANGVSQVWGYQLGRATSGTLYLVGIVHFDNMFLVEPSTSEVSDTECTIDDAIPLLDSQVVLPDAASRLPPGAVFENAFFSQRSGCLASDWDERHMVTVFHSPEAVSYTYYAATGDFVQQCGPCDRGTAAGACEPCSN